MMRHYALLTLLFATLLPTKGANYTERVTNGNLEGEGYYSFGYYGYYNQSIKASDVVEDPADALNHCIRLGRSNTNNYPDLHIKFATNTSTLYAGQKYKFSMRVKASQATKIHSRGMTSYGGIFDNNMIGTFDVTTSWTTISYEGVATDDQNGLAWLSFVFADNDVDYYFDDISLQVDMGDLFRASTAEGSELYFTVISADQKTCAVGNLTRNDGSHVAYTDVNVNGKLTIPATVQYLGDTYAVRFVGEGAFAGNTYFDNIIIPKGVTYLGNSAFWNSILKSVSIPSTVKSFGLQVFSANYQLQSVYSYIRKPFVFNEAVFSGKYNSQTSQYDFTTATLFVPAGKKSVYESTVAWDQFTTIEEMPLAGDVNNDDTVNVSDIVEVVTLIQNASYQESADVNGDGLVNADDLDEIRDIILDE